MVKDFIVKVPFVVCLFLHLFLPLNFGRLQFTSTSCSLSHRTQCLCSDYTKISLEDTWGCFRIQIILKIRATILKLHNTTPTPSPLSILVYFYYGFSPFPRGTPSSPILFYLFHPFCLFQSTPSFPLFSVSLTPHQSMHFSVTLLSSPTAFSPIHPMLYSYSLSLYFVLVVNFLTCFPFLHFIVISPHFKRGPPKILLKNITISNVSKPLCFCNQLRI